MSHYAKVVNGVVEQVIVAEADVIAAFADSNLWIQTSYRTRHNQHPEGQPLRGNYAGIGGTYHPEHDIFMPPRPAPSWILNPVTASWDPPVPRPTDGAMYVWDEDTQNWIAPVLE